MNPFGVLFTTSAIVLYFVTGNMTLAQTIDAQTHRFYIGTYTGGKAKSKGIYLSSLNLATGVLSKPELAAGSPNPSFLALHPSGQYLYAANEIDAGTVTAFRIDPKTKRLSQINEQSTHGPAPCHLVVDQTGQTLLVANYSGGNVASLPITAMGSLEPATSVIQHEGASIDRARQQEPHAHSINLDKANQLAFAADLGLDQIRVYQLDNKNHSLTPNTLPFATVAPGSGPRHFAFRPNGEQAYVINEINSTITVFDYNPQTGGLFSKQTISTLPADFQGNNNSTAHIAVSSNGKFVYGSNRGHDSIAVFQADSDGRLTFVEAEPTQGQTPRNFAIDPSGQFLLAENQNTNSIVVFRIDQESGALEPTGNQVDVPSPVCIQFLPE